MRLPVELLDNIFSFLVSHLETLAPCLKDPVLSKIVERHLYHSVAVHFDYRGLSFSRFFPENPRVLHCVRILSIRVTLDYSSLKHRDHLDQFAKTLLRFPVLECVKIDFNACIFDCPDVLRAALDDCLNLPTLKEIHIHGNLSDFPCSLIDNHKNIESLTFRGTGWRVQREWACVSTLPQLKSLTLLSPSPLALVMPHISELRSLKCVSSALEDLPALLGVCSQTLNKSDIDLTQSSYFITNDDSNSSPIGEFTIKPLPPVPHLQQLTVRAVIHGWLDYSHHPPIFKTESYLPAASTFINSFFSSLQHLILEIGLNVNGMASSLTKVDFSPLAVLETALRSIPRTDLYVHNFLSSPVTLARLVSSLADCDAVLRSIKEGKLVIHSETM